MAADFFGGAPDALADLPKGRFERALALQIGIVSHVAEGSIDATVYQTLRRELLDDPATEELLPTFVRVCRDVGALWGWAKGFSPHWEPRRQHVRETFGPLLDYLEKKAAPADELISGTLSAFDVGGVHKAWEKALKRTERDPEGAITAARSLLETICKHILDQESEPGALYTASDDLPRLYRLAAEKLQVAPSQHTEAVFKRILGGCSSVVEGLGSLRNKVGDAHGQGKRPVRVLTRHAHLAVNLAGAMALFMVETSDARRAAES